MTRRYYTLEDVLIKLGKASKGPFTMREYSFGFINFLNQCLNKAGLSEIQGVIEGAEGYECFSNHIWPRFYKEPIFYIDEDDENKNIVEVFSLEEIGKIFSWWKSSLEKYTLLINNLERNKSKLLDDVKNQSETRFNDTPQDTGDFSDDMHTSTITSVVNTSNAGTVLQRLNEIEDNIKELYYEWSSEFKKFIIWSVN